MSTRSNTTNRGTPMGRVLSRPRSPFSTRQSVFGDRGFGGTSIRREVSTCRTLRGGLTLSKNQAPHGLIFSNRTASKVNFGRCNPRGCYNCCDTCSSGVRVGPCCVSSTYTGGKSRFSNVGAITRRNQRTCRCSTERKCVGGPSGGCSRGGSTVSGSCGRGICTRTSTSSPLAKADGCCGVPYRRSAGSFTGDILRGSCFGSTCNGSIGCRGRVTDRGFTRQRVRS